MGYKILIKASGLSTNELFKFYREPGIPTDLEVETIEELTPIYEQLIEKYPKGQVIPVHKLKITLNTEIKDEEIQPVPENEKTITGITALADERNLITLIANGENLFDTDVFNWTIVCDSATTYHLTSMGPSVNLTEVQSSTYESSDIVTASISIGKGEKFFTIKE